MAINTNIEFEGERELRDTLDDYRKNASEAFGAALYERAQAIMTTSKKKYVPVDTGRLRSSGFVSSPERSTGGSIQVIVGFGTKYAPFVHEATEMKLEGLPRSSGRGNYWDPDAEARFLSKAINDHKSSFLSQVAKAAEEFIETGKGIAIRSGEHPTKPKTNG